MDGDICNVIIFNDELSGAELAPLGSTTDETVYFETFPTDIKNKAIWGVELSSRDDSVDDLVGTNNGTINGSVSANG